MNVIEIAGVRVTDVIDQNAVGQIAGVASVDPASGPEAQRKFRDVLGQFATGVTIITTVADDGERIGMTVNSFSSLSLDPPLILWGIGNNATGYKSFQVGSSFAVNVMSDDQQDVALRFAKSTGEKFKDVELHPGLGDVPLIAGCVAYLECVTEARHLGGDHDIIVGRVRRIFNVGRQPLLFHCGKFRALAPLPDAAE